MTEKEIFMAYMPQIAEIAGNMEAEEYGSWKSEVYKATPEKALGFMEKVFMVMDYLVLA